MTQRLKLFSRAILCAGGIAMLAPAVAVATPRSRGPAQVQEIRCRYIEDDNGRAITLEAPGLRVLSQTAAEGRFHPNLPEGINGIMCSRTSLVPGANDDEVLWLGMPLFIAEMGTPGRLGVLEINDGRYRYRMIEGQVAPDEQAALDARLDEFQARFQALQQRQRTAR